MDERARRATFAAALVWLLWAMYAVTDLIQFGSLSPFALVMLVGLLGGQILVWLGVVPNPMPRTWALATYAIIAFVMFGLAAHLVIAALLPG